MTGTIRRAITVVAMSVAIVTPLYADVTLTQKTSGKGFGFSGAGDSVTYIKGTKMRTEQTIRGELHIIIVDAGAQKMIVLNQKKGEAEIHDMTRIAADLQKITDADIKVQLTPTTESKPIVGQTCFKHNVLITVGASPVPDQKIDIVLSGPVWIAKDAPGKADYAAFYKMAAEKGLFFGDPKVVKAQPGQAKGFTTMYRTMAEAGVPLASDVQVRFEGSGMMATMMNKMGAMTMSTETVAISSDPISDDKFAVPAGYKTTTK